MTTSHEPRRTTGHAVLIFPPVWVPMVPHLALPVLTAYLRKQGKRVTPIDANVDFFVNYLFTQEVLSSHLAQIPHVLATDRVTLPPPWLGVLRREEGPWEQTIASIDQIFAAFQDPSRFYSPDTLLQAMDQTQSLLHLVSIARWPGRISLNHYQRGDIKNEFDLVELSENRAKNIFLPYWEQRVLPKIDRIAPIIVGISISSVHQFVAAMTLARLLRKRCPEVHVVVGGKHMIRMREKLLEHAFYFKEFFHSAVLHEGERPLESLVNALENNTGLGNVPSLIYRLDDRTVASPRCESPALEDLPYPDFSDLDWSQYLMPKRYLPIRMSEGCYWGKCTFCARYGAGGVVLAPPQRVVDELERMEELYGVRHVSVNDDCMPPQYWEEVCQEIIARGLNISMLIWAKPVAGFTRRRLQMMAEAGIRQIRWGVESAHPRILKLMRKGTSLPTMRRVLSDALGAGIWNHACIILGFPTETEQEAGVTVDFLRNHTSLIHSFILYAFVLYKDSFIFQHPKAFGIRDIQITETPFSDAVSYTARRGMTPSEVRPLLEAARTSLLDKAYGRPFWHFLKLREYLQLYLDRYGLQKTINMPFNRTRMIGS